MKAHKATRRKPQILLVFQTRHAEAIAMLRGIAKYESSHGVWAAYLDDEARAERDPDWLGGKAWDGVISLHTTRAFAAECQRLKIPLVDLNDRSALPGVHQIRPDNVAIGHMGAEHFIERGYRNFGFCGHSDLDWSVERRRGFIEGASLAGFSCELHEPPFLRGDGAPEWQQNLVPEIAAWLAARPLPLAVMACHDTLAIQVMQACEHIGRLVPEEVAVLGVEDDAIRCELSYPPLSSIATNRFFSGYAAAELLDRLMSGEKIKAAEIRTEPTRVMVRHSTDILAIEDKTVASALGYIRDNACMGISVANVLEHVAASRSQLEKKFRQYIGRSPQTEIRQVQMAKAKQLLLETDFPLKKIAELVGFEHPEYLSVVFKRHTKQAPGTYRQHVQAETGPRPPGSSVLPIQSSESADDKRTQVLYKDSHSHFPGHSL
jgi:LacI family transcriptional regulator